MGVFIFAVSGALAERAKGMNYFGMFVVGLITGTGGGTLRSVLIGGTFGGILRYLLRMEVPLIFRREIYATAAIATATLSIATIRILALRHSLFAQSFQELTNPLPSFKELKPCCLVALPFSSRSSH